MATRCTIKIEGAKHAKIYKHFDGSPDSILDLLEDFNKDFLENRGVDPDYQMAQLLRNKPLAETDPSKYTGWGVVAYSDDMGAQYEYILKSNGNVTYQAKY